MTPGVRQVAAAALVTIAMAGCQPAPAGPTAPAPSPSSGTSVPGSLVPVSVVVDERIADIIPPGFGIFAIEFSDVNHGYVVLSSTNPVNLATTKDPEEFQYTYGVFATADGGRTWTRLTEPRRPARLSGLWVLDARTIALEVTDEGWYVSRDGGATFRFVTGPQYPPEIGVYDARYLARPHAECEYTCRIVANGTLLTPGLPGRSTAATEADGVIWAASLDGVGGHTALSRDRGRTWQPRDVPTHPMGAPTLLDLRVSVDGRDVWLVGYLGEFGGRLGGMGSVLPVRRKEGGIPLLWLFEGDRWVPKGTVDPPDPNRERYNSFEVAAIGGGLAAVAGPHGLNLVDTAWRRVDLRPGAASVGLLPDGTIFAANDRHTVFYLGTRTGSEIGWVRLIIDAQRSPTGAGLDRGHRVLSVGESRTDAAPHQPSRPGGCRGSCASAPVCSRRCTCGGAYGPASRRGTSSTPSRGSAGSGRRPIRRTTNTS